MHDYLLGGHVIPITTDKGSEASDDNLVLGQFLQNPVTLQGAFSCHAQNLQLKA